MNEWLTVARAEEIAPNERLVIKVDDAQVVDQRAAIPAHALSPSSTLADRRGQLLRDRNQGYATYRFLLLDALY